MSVRPGFTMLELLLVLAVIGLGAGIAAARLGGLRTHQVADQAAQQVMDQARRCRELALSRGVPVRLRLEAATGQATVRLLSATDEADPADGQPTDLPLREGADDLTLTLRRDDGQAAADGVIDLLFRPDGRCDPPGLVVLASHGRQVGVRLAAVRPAVMETVEATP
jgi:type II secretion system protein H